MIRYSVTSNIRLFERGVSDIDKRQMPFATALALTRTAQGNDFQSPLISAEQTLNLGWYRSAIDLLKSLGSMLLDGSNVDKADVNMKSSNVRLSSQVAPVVPGVLPIVR